MSHVVGRGALADFLDDRVYRQWVKANGAEPELEDVLGWKVPQSAGAPIHAKASRGGAGA